MSNRLQHNLMSIVLEMFMLWWINYICRYLLKKHLCLSRPFATWISVIVHKYNISVCKLIVMIIVKRFDLEKGIALYKCRYYYYKSLSECYLANGHYEVHNLWVFCFLFSFCHLIFLGTSMITCISLMLKAHHL